MQEPVQWIQPNDNFPWDPGKVRGCGKVVIKEESTKDHASDI